MNGLSSSTFTSVDQLDRQLQSWVVHYNTRRRTRTPLQVLTSHRDRAAAQPDQHTRKGSTVTSTRGAEGLDSRIPLEHLSKDSQIHVA